MAVSWQQPARIASRCLLWLSLNDTDSIGPNFKRAMVATALGEKLLIGLHPSCKELDPATFSLLFHCELRYQACFCAENYLCTKEKQQKLLPPELHFWLQYAPNRLSAGASSQTPLGAYSATGRAYILLLQGGKWRKGEGKGREGRGKEMRGRERRGEEGKGDEGKRMGMERRGEKGAKDGKRRGRERRWEGREGASLFVLCHRKKKKSRRYEWQAGAFIHYTAKKWSW